ncbi:MFS transporter [Granulicella tundricola]|uniref:Major facilitator superfamily MFS_1 n=1 Tax=Granulicella tundricola (strain ATCC BAA-1859 / DSM 23138 / MP5ACTX9) TaxID=1198114 RepID=E8WXB1_GRATM|nr:MFS transporter [Granulicella tundricola]ADW67444.1 major facilitator superfamily MFS_1 [Granulicella tundricola MP5ACTX9]
MASTNTVSGLRAGGALQSRDFRLYQAARFMVILGAEAQSVAVAWQVYQLTHSALSLGYTGLALFLPGLFFVLPAGHVADRYDKRWVILGCYGAQIVCTFILLWIALHPVASIAPIYVVLFLMGMGRCFSGPAASAMVPMLVPKEDFVNAVTWGATVYQTANATGPMVGGLLFTATLGAAFGHWGGAPIVYLFTLVMLAGFMVLVGAIRVRAVTGEKKAFNANTMLAGMKYVLKTRLLLGSISLDLFAVLLGGAVALMPIFAHDVLHAGPQGLGLLRAMPSLGALAVSITLIFRPLKRNAGKTMLWCVAIFGAATILFGLSHTIWISMVALLLVGASDMVSVVIRSSVLQLATPPEMRGRVSAVNWLFIGASNEFGEFESGVTAHWFGAVRAVVLGGIGSLLVTGAAAVLFPALRNADQLTAESLRAAEVELAEAEPID